MPEDLIILQSYYNDGETVVASKRVNCNIHTGEVSYGDISDVADAIADSDIIETQYYDLAGNKLTAAPDRGFVIVRSVCADGSATVKKIMK